LGDLSYDSGAGAIVGIQTSGEGLLYSDNTPALSDGLAILFLPPGSAHRTVRNAADLTFAVKASTPLPVNTWITNTATFTDSRSVVYQRSAGTLINSVNLSSSTKQADRTQAAVGDPVNYAIVLRNSGLYTATGASLSDPVPANTTWNGVAPTCTSGTCGRASGVITWTGNITPGGSVVVGFGVTHTLLLADGAPVTNTATINDGSGNLITRQAVFKVRTPNLGTAYKTVTPATLPPGGVATYTVYVYNSGGGNGGVQLVDPLPAGLTFVPGSLSFGAGAGGYANGVITWTGSVPAFSQIPVRFRATVDAQTPLGTVIVNTATITDMVWNTDYPRTAALTVEYPYRVYLPIVVK
jgi:uncharacterized repeat protein (TIGR01451 family)